MTPPNDSAVEANLLDDLFDSDDPRLQSGLAEEDTGDDLDFIQSTGLTSPDTSMQVGAMEGLPDLGDVASDPVSFYEPGVADVDAAMTPGLEAAASPSERRLDERVDGAADLEEDIVPVPRTTEADTSEERLNVIDLDALDDESDAELDEKAPVEALDAVQESEPVLEAVAASIVVNDDIDGAPADPTDDGSPDAHATLDHSNIDDVFSYVPSDTPEPIVEAAGPPPPSAPARSDDEPAHAPAPVQTRGRRSHSHHRRHQPAWPRMLRMGGIGLVFATVLAYGGYQAYRWFEIQVTNPTTLYYEAEAAAANERHLQSARLFNEFVQRRPSHPLAADALFAAGYQMQQVETEDEELARQYSEEALALLGAFTDQYPDHDRAGRAFTLMGFIHYRMGNYRAAVDSFIGRDAMLRDPSATLPMLRTLARAYAHLGDYEAAHSTYVRAANAPGNSSPDTDYDELGEMYRALAQSADTPEDHTAYQELALEHWGHAMRYPGINPTRKNAIRVKVDLLGDLGAIHGTPTVLPVDSREAAGSAFPAEPIAEASLAAFDEPIPLPLEPAAAPFTEEVEAPKDLGDPTEFSVEPADPDPAAAEDFFDGEVLTYHEIAPGEMLSQIALDYGISKADLMRWNDIENPDHIEVGQRLVLQGPAAPAE